ncbi:MAG: 5,6-dimethylbenzimidazole synthase [Hyphomicrobium sp.]|nr:5,6-dimethylbenzimidazole synthase [Hyphomicrobium sp.]
MKFTADQAETLARIQMWRRDVRHFKREGVTEDVLERLRAAMDTAPSVGNARPWRVIRVEDISVRSAVRAEFERCNINAAQTYAGPTKDAYLALKLAGLDAAPVQLAVFTAVNPDEGHRLGRLTMPQTLRQSTAMAIHALWLAARAENLGLGMISILDPKRIETILNVGADWEFSAYLCIGWPESDDDTPLLHRAGWQTNNGTRWEVR